MRTYCRAQGTLLSAVVTSMGRESRKRGEICKSVADSLSCTEDTKSIVKQLYSNKN